MRVGLAIAVAASLSASACGGKASGGASTPEELGKNMVAAVQRGDVAAVKAMYPTKAALDAAMTCPEGEGPWRKVERELSKVEKGLAEMKRDAQEFLGVDTSEDKVESLKAGETYKGCAAKADVTLMRTRWKMKVTEAGNADERSFGVALIQLDGVWYVLDI
ncbi:MAG: hypothetical protein KC635_28150 [Myxococcales bacterium]|nr:hypothetical protein [Myxococcales bacterium]MCB9733616.1 hypothetical protein [Deltaproteobacteria bacterium]